MKNCLLFISLLFLLCQPCVAQETGDSVVSREYNLLMQVKGQELTSICMMNVSPDGSIVGTVVSEMGMKAFDFTYDHGKAKVLNVVVFLNKWYIRRVLRKDLAYILPKLEPDQECHYKRRWITYTFTPMNNETD